MHIVMGGTGGVGSAVVKALLDHGEPVTVVTRDAAKAEALADPRVVLAEADVNDTTALRDVFRSGSRAFLLNPPGDPTEDNEAQELRSVKSILSALEDSGLERVVAQSTYGAQPGPDLADLGTLFELEQGLKAQSIPFSIQRGAYYMSNLAMSLDGMRKEGVLQTFFPADFVLPMVAPADLGKTAAMLLTEGETGGLHHVEGPRRYSLGEAADVFSQLLGHPIQVEAPPRDQIEASIAAIGFSPEGTRSFAGMTRAALEETPPPPPETNVWKGATTLEAFAAALVKQ